MGRATANFTNAMAVGLAGKIRQLKLALLDDYHPELHYMRGPGPKWREKHGQLPASNDLLELDLNGLGKAGA